MKSQITVGITGGIGAGKSVVCRILSIMGYPVFYADIIAKELLLEADVAIQVKTIFGNQSYHDTTPNRAFIARQIFSDPVKKNQLTALIHPLVKLRFENWKNAQPESIVFNEAAILFETGRYLDFTKNILVTAAEEIKIKRVLARDGITADEIKQRMANQWSDEQKMTLADYVIMNDDQHALVPQVLNMLKVLKS